MHKGTHRLKGEHQEDLHSSSYRSEHRVVRERDDAGQHKSVAGHSQWVFGNLFECLSDNEECAHGRIPFGSNFYCIWPLKNTSADFCHKPPCSWDAVQD